MLYAALEGPLFHVDVRGLFEIEESGF